MVKAGKLVIRWFLVPLSPWQFILGLVSLFMWQDQITVLVLPNFSVLIKAQYQKFFFLSMAVSRFVPLSFKYSTFGFLQQHHC